MDALSQLIGSLDLRGRLDLRCEFGAAWTADHAALPPGHAPYHVVLAGRCLVELPDAGQRVKLGTGDILVLPRGARHVVRNAGAPSTGQPERPLEVGHNGVLAVKRNIPTGQSAEVEILCGVFEFRAERHGLIVDSLPDHFVVASAERAEFESLRNLVRLMACETERPRIGGEAIVTELSTALFAMVLRAHLETQSLPAGALALLADARLRAALQAMLDTPERDWTVAELADLAHMSRPSFARSFARLSGSTPILLLTRLRMERAVVLLQQGEAGIAEVGERVGYRSEAAFNRAFTRHAGVGPGTVRRRNRR